MWISRLQGQGQGGFPNLRLKFRLFESFNVLDEGYLIYFKKTALEPGSGTLVSFSAYSISDQLEGERWSLAGGQLLRYGGWRTR